MSQPATLGNYFCESANHFTKKGAPPKVLTQGFAADPVYNVVCIREGEVLAYVGSIQNLKDLKDIREAPKPSGRQQLACFLRLSC